MGILVQKKNRPFLVPVCTIFSIQKKIEAVSVYNALLQ
jgi:hypothetical protein